MAKQSGVQHRFYLKHAPVGRLTKFKTEVTGNGEIVSRFYYPETGNRIFEYKIERNKKNGVVLNRSWMDVTPHDNEKKIAA